MTEIQAEYRTPASEYRLDGGLPVPLELKDSPSMKYQFGYYRGTALALDLFDWFAAYKAAAAKQNVCDRSEVMSNATEFVRAMMEDAANELIKPQDDGGNSHRGQAVGVLDSLALLVVSALEGTKDARADLYSEIQTSLHHSKVANTQGINHAMNVNRRDVLA